MGCALSSNNDVEGATRLKDIYQARKQDAKNTENLVKLVLLGAGDSGKSTIVKQMKILYQKGYSNDEKKTYRENVFATVIESMMAIVKAMSNLKIEFENPDRQSDVKIVQIASRSIDNYEMTREISEAVQRLWADAGVRECFDHAGKFQLNNSAEYYFDELTRLSETNYIPTIQDVLCSRVKTTGIIESDFSFKNLQFRLIDTGGARSERKKWRFCLEDVTAIIFCVALSEYDLTLAEDDETNRMQDSLKLFDSLCNNAYFRNTLLILFLNKTDLFRKKIKKIPITICFPDYNGESTFDQAATFIQVKFESLNRQQEKVIYTHFICAIDTSNVRFVFNAVSDVIRSKMIGDLKVMPS